MDASLGGEGGDGLLDGLDEASRQEVARLQAKYARGEGVERVDEDAIARGQALIDQQYREAKAPVSSDGWEVRICPACGGMKERKEEYNHRVFTLECEECKGEGTLKRWAGRGDPPPEPQPRGAADLPPQERSVLRLRRQVAGYTRQRDRYQAEIASLTSRNTDQSPATEDNLVSELVHQLQAQVRAVDERLRKAEEDLERAKLAAGAEAGGAGA